MYTSATVIWRYPRHIELSIFEKFLLLEAHTAIISVNTEVLHFVSFG